MAKRLRSLELTSYEKYVEKEDGGKKTMVWEEIPSDELENIPSNGGRYRVKVKIDNQDGNLSFTVNTFNAIWLTYEIERISPSDWCDTKIDGYAYVIFKIHENLKTAFRSCMFEVEHNVANIKEEIMLFQDGAEYSVDVKYNNGSVFQCVPLSKQKETAYEDKNIIISALNGRRKWELKEIRQYEVLEGDSFDETNGFIGDIEENEKMFMSRVPYDGSFNCRINENILNIRSYGKISIANVHMRYFFVIQHSDVDNANNEYLDAKYKDKNNPSYGKYYKCAIMFTFDNNDIDGYKQ